LLLLVWEIYQFLELLDKVPDSLFCQQVFGIEPDHRINHPEVLVGGGLGYLESFPDVGPKGLGVFFLQEPVPVDSGRALGRFCLGAGLKVIKPPVKVQDRLFFLLEVNAWDWIPTLGLADGEPLDRSR